MDQQQKLYEEGLVLKKHRHYGDALSCFEQVVELDANHAEAWFRIGCCRSEIAKQNIENSEDVLGARKESEIYEPAIQAFLKAIKLRPALADAREDLTELFYNYFDCLECLGDAKAAYQNAIKLQPDCAVARKFLAELFYDYAERQTEIAREEEDGAFYYSCAIDWCKQAVEICPQMLDACCQQMVWIYTCWMNDAIHEAQVDDAIAPSETCMDIDKVADGLIESHQKLIQIRPNDFNAYYELGNAHRTRVDATILTTEYVDKHYGCFDEDVIKEMKQGTDPFVRENLEKAIEAYHTAVGIKPDYANAYSALAESCQWIGQLEEAIQAFRQAIVHGNREHSNLARIYHKLGKKHFDDGKYTEAIECYHSAIVTNSKYDEVYYDLGVANDETGRYELAVLWYQRVRSACGDPVLRYNDDLFDSAKHIYAHVRDSYNYPDLHYRLGKTYHRIGQYEDAVEAYLVAIDRFIVIEEAYHEACYEIERNAVPIKQEYLSYLLPDPPQQPEWWDDVFKYKDSASRNEPL